eukprot:COSAG02_NODE_14210_length_1297_cov_0.964942_2_plen_99_part_00
MVTCHTNWCNAIEPSERTASAASTGVFSNTSTKCCAEPAPEDAMTGIVTAAFMALTSPMSKPELVPSLSMQLSNISPAPWQNKGYSKDNHAGSRDLAP